MIDLILFCFGTASLTVFLDMCFEDGMILHGYYKAIYRLPKVLFKPLGGCVYCFSVWVFVLFFFSFRVETNLLGLFIGLGINYVFIKAIEKL
jgi:hypothetical protein